MDSRPGRQTGFQLESPSLSGGIEFSLSGAIKFRCRPPQGSNGPILHIHRNFAQGTGTNALFLRLVRPSRRSYACISEQGYARDRVCTGLWAVRIRKNRLTQGVLRFPQAEWLYLAPGFSIYHRNTRCCGFELTDTIDSAIFASAAVNRLLIELEFSPQRTEKHPV